ncbi:MAG: BPL-N domain-containing protein [Candidatus Bathyarchaeota archaeon]|nr:BPL-N domain-containing protein [Candidatus Bathyarchaeota archaeon]
MRTIITLVIVFSSLLLVIIFSATSPNASSTHEKIAVAIFQGRDTGGVDSLAVMFRRLNCTVTIVHAQQINSVGLEGFDILCFPGGDMYLYSQEFSSAGIENMRNFIRNGGACFGVCGGAFFSSERVVWRGNQLPMTSLGVFPGTAQGPIDEISVYPNGVIAQVNVVNSTHPITQGGPATYGIYYGGGPFFIPNPDANATVLGRYDIGNQPVIVAFEYGNGRGVIFGTHPEVVGTDWDFINRAVLWLTEKQT